MIFNKYVHIWHSNLSAYLDAQVSVAKGRRIEAHLAGCQVCTARLADLRDVQTALRELEPDALWDAALPPWSAIEKDLGSAPISAPFLIRYGPRLAGAGCSALLLILALYYYLPTSTPHRELAPLRTESSDLYQYIGDRLFAPEKVLLGDAVAIRPELEEAVLPENVYFHARSLL
jgi:hypothetical protein